MKKNLSKLLVFTLLISIMGCASDCLEAPCPNFGAACKKTPVNSWDYFK